MLGHIPQPAISNLEKAVMWYEGLRASGLDSSLSQTRDKRVPVAATGSGPLAGKLAPEYPEWSGCQSWLFHQSRQDVHRASCLPSTMPGLGLTLVLTREQSQLPPQHDARPRPYAGLNQN